MCKAAKGVKRPRAVAKESLGHEERHVIASLVAGFVRRTKEGDAKQSPKEKRAGSLRGKNSLFTFTRIFRGRRRRGTPRASERFMCQRCGAS